MKSSILSVGTELLFGQIVNTNTVYLSQQLNTLGIDVMSHHTVGDNSKRLSNMIRQSFEECDLIITTGGLGPTQDDLTKEVACEVLDDELVFHKPAMDILEGHFKRFGSEVTENNLKQAYLPSRATVFLNELGTAPGFALEKDGKIIICLPGPPKELTYLFENKVRPFLENLTEGSIYYRILRLYGIGESKLETELLDLINNQTDPTIATYAKEGECSVRVASKRKSKEEAEIAVENMIEKIKQKVGNFVYSTDDEELYQVVGRKLIERNISFSCAESCTGGLFAQTMTEIPGISAVFDRGLVTYSNRSKIEELGVNPKTLEKYGAVSREVAIEMAKGLKKISKSRLCVSVTGIAGPDGGTAEKPVGLIYVCVILDDNIVCEKPNIKYVDRRKNRNYAKLLMLDTINKMLDS